MTESHEFRRVRARWLLYGGLLGLLWVNLPVMSAQSSVTVTVEDTHGKAVPNVKVIGRGVEKKKGEEETLVGEVLTLSKNEEKKSDGTTYRIRGLAKGKYKFYACEPDLNYEPDYKEISLGDSDARKFSLILPEQSTTLQIDDPSLKPASNVCLVHEETGCSAIKVIEPNGEIKSAGVRNHYRVEGPDACKSN